MNSFTHIVSLGHRCRTTHRLREHYGFKTAFVFDWWISPLAGAVGFLRDWDLERLYAFGSLREVRRWRRRLYIENTDYLIRLQHEFPMDEARQLVLPGWQAHVGEAKARTEHLMRKFEALNRLDRRVLFVRELKPEEQAQPALIADLRAAVLERAPRAKAQFLLISPKGVQAEGWIPLGIDDPVAEPWTGAADIWDAALAGLDFRLERPANWGQTAEAAQAPAV